MDSASEFSSDSDSESASDSECEFDRRLVAWMREREEQEFMRGYEEAQSRLRLSMTCKEMVRPLTHPLLPRIVELAKQALGR